MFVQMIEGQVADRDGLRRQLDRWDGELGPGAEGFLGSTTGVTDDGYFLGFVRFESPAAARANSNRPEQGQWWAETERCFEGEATFTDCNEVETFWDGGSDDTGFVQVIRSAGLDRDRVRQMDAAFDRHRGWRPDIIGGMRLWTGADSATDVLYFTSEAEAREGERKEPPPELAAAMSEFRDSMPLEFFDLREPRLRSA